MAFAPLLRQHVLPLAGLTTALTLCPTRTVYAEEPPSDPKSTVRRKRSFDQNGVAHHVQRSRKPIYDDSWEAAPHVAATTPLPASGITKKPQKEEDPPVPRKPSPTDRLAEQIKASRLFLHSQAVKVEDTVNNSMTRFLNAEQSFTSTIASLAPPKESNEKVLPGGIYVLVAAMAGSIISRNRNLLVRFVTPIITGTVTAHYVVPRTTENVGNLIWSYEEKVPLIRDNHLRISQGVKHFIETGKAHSQMGLAMAEGKVQEAREGIQDWVKKGR